MNRNRCYSFSCDFPIRYVNGCPESKTLSLKYQHLQLKSKHCYLKKNWRWWCNRYLRNHGFLQREKLEYLKFRLTEVIHKKLFLSLVKMHYCVWYLWTCPSQNAGLHNFGGQIGLGYFFGGKKTTVTFVKVLGPMIVKCLNKKKPYRESS